MRFIGINHEIEREKKLKKVALLSLVVLVLAGLIGGLTGCSHKAGAVTLNVSAASSLTNALGEVNDLYTQKHPNVTITPNFDASGTLQKQIENGGPCDVFISAAAKNMDTLENTDNLILSKSRKNLLTNKIVLIVPSDSTLGLTSFDNLTLASVKTIAFGDPAIVPAGQYGKAALTELGIYDQVKSKFLLCAKVTDVLTYVASGNVDAGIVYATDALSSDQVKVVAEGPADVNATIVYPVAVIKASANPDAAQKYVDFLSSDQAKTVFENYGFVMAAD